MDRSALPTELNAAPEQVNPHRQWVRDAFLELQPLLTGVYTNFVATKKELSMLSRLKCALNTRMFIRCVSDSC